MLLSKVCAWCREAYPVDCFLSQSQNRDGLSSYCRRCNTARANREVAGLREAALTALGGVCGVCGIDALDVLVIDHPQGGGRADRRAIGGPRVFYRWVADHPSEYQALCHNCNHRKRVREQEHGAAGPWRRAEDDEVWRKAYDARQAEEQEASTSAKQRMWKRPEYRAAQAENMRAAWTEERRAATRAKALAERAARAERIEANRVRLAGRSAWSRRFVACLGCERTEQPHKSRGLCASCYRTAQRDLTPVEA